MKFAVMGVVLVVSLAGCGVDLVEDNHVYRVAPENYIARGAIHSKPGVGVFLVNRQVNLEGAGAQYAITIDIQSSDLSGDLTLSIEPSEGLYVVNGDISPMQPLAPRMSFPLTVHAVSNGRYYLYMNAVADVDGQSRSRALALIVQVGDEGSEVDTSLSKSGEFLGEETISMPAKEEIIR